MLKVTVRLIGPFAVSGPRHEDLTPKGTKTCALLALLAVANGAFCSRSWLQDKLWSDRSPQQGQDSLRHAISNLKQALGDSSHILILKGRTIALDRDCALIDLYDDLPQESLLSQPEQFLAGLEVNDREFAAWQQSMRVNLSSPQVLHDRDPSSVVQSGIHIGLLPVESVGRDTAAEVLGSSLLHRIGTSLRNLGPFSIYDYSGNGQPNPDKFMGPDVLMIVRSIQMGDCLSVTLSLHRVVDKKVIWSALQTLPLGPQCVDMLSNIVIQVTDQIASVLAHQGILGDKERHQAARLVLGALDRMFASSNDDLDAADIALTQATELEQKGVYYAWHAYFLVFRLEAVKGQGMQQEIMQQANELAEKALAIDGNNPLTLALLTHVYAFIFRDFNRAQTLIEPALAINSDALMVQDSYALLNFYMGNMSIAREAARKVLNAGLFNPYRYCFATSMCMIETVSENYDAAVEYGEQALAMHSPTQEVMYAPTLRYLAAAQARKGNIERASEVFAMLKKQDPEFAAGDIFNDDFPVPSKRAASLLQKSLNAVESGQTIV